MNKVPTSTINTKNHLFCTKIDFSGKTLYSNSSNKCDCNAVIPSEKQNNSTAHHCDYRCQLIFANPKKLPHWEKRNFIKQIGICFKCLTKGGHISTDCIKPLTCTICKNQHHGMLTIRPLESSQQQNGAPVHSRQMPCQADTHIGVSSTDHYKQCRLSIVLVQKKVRFAHICLYAS